jgi:hypothetical protein
MQELGFSLEMGSQLQNKNLGKHVLSVIKASADPDVESYTREIGVHNVIDMALALKLLGDQTIQLTVRNGGETITSWILKTTREGVEYIQVIPGKTDLNTINLEIDLDDFGFEESNDLDIIDVVRILGKMLASNRGIKKQPNMIRLLMAGGLELVTSYLKNDRPDSRKKSCSYHPVE